VKTENILHEFEVYDVNSSVGKQAGLYWQQYNKQFKTLSLADCLIAVTANVNNLTLVSLNVKYFPMNDLKMLTPQS
jgi:predicted nucleic acid-binding protein